MGVNQRRRQKKQEQRAGKRKEKKHELARQKSAGLAERLTAACQFPVFDCRIPEALWTEGIGWVLLSRQLPSGLVAVAVFLVDCFCLGVKDAFAEFLPQSNYIDEYIVRMRANTSLRVVAPADALKLLDDAVAYARTIGLSPHPDYRKARALFGSVDPADSKAVYEFGKDGQPFFISGPNDTPARCRQIVAILSNTCGPGGFHYLVSGRGSELVDVISDDVPGRRLTLADMDEEN